jgi:hypothetical protein
LPRSPCPRPPAALGPRRGPRELAQLTIVNFCFYAFVCVAHHYIAGNSRLQGFVLRPGCAACPNGLHIRQVVLRIVWVTGHHQRALCPHRDQRARPPSRMATRQFARRAWAQLSGFAASTTAAGAGPAPAGAAAATWRNPGLLRALSAEAAGPTPSSGGGGSSSVSGTYGA